MTIQLDEPSDSDIIGAYVKKKKNIYIITIAHFIYIQKNDT